MQELIEFVKDERFAHSNYTIELKATELLEKEKEQSKPLIDALVDIRDWNDELADKWGDPGERAKDAINIYMNLNQKNNKNGKFRHNPMREKCRRNTSFGV